jgi:nucleoside-diphosphate-sugar epimerase
MLLKVLVTGNKGYVGSVITEELFKQKFDVLGLDVGFFPKGFVESKYDVNTINKDVRDIEEADIQDCDAIIHLAALSNDPLGELDSSLTNEINYLSTIRLAKMAKEIGVERFIFSSSCSIYGANDDEVNEESKMEPLTAYAKSKVQSEKELLKLKDDDFSPIILRNATVYGVSPSQRLDLVVNNLVGSAVTTNKIHLMSDGTSWRPLLHVEDMALAFIHMLKSPKEKISGEIFNVGNNNENFRVIQIAEKIREIIPNTEIEFSREASKDKRSYKVNFDKIKNELGFETKWTLEKGIKQIFDVMKKRNFSNQEFKSEKYYRVTHINSLIKEEKINNVLKFIK